MQHMVDALAGFVAGGEVADVALDEAERRPTLFAHEVAHHVEVALVAGEEIVEAHHALSLPEQGLQQVGADEPGYARDKPCARAGVDVLQDGVERAHCIPPGGTGRRCVRYAACPGGAYGLAGCIHLDEACKGAHVRSCER